MRSKTQRAAGRHRQVVTSQTTKGRVALFTVAAGAVSTAGATGAATAQMQSLPTPNETVTRAQTLDLSLAGNSLPIETINQQVSTAATAAASTTAASATTANTTASTTVASTTAGATTVASTTTATTTAGSTAAGSTAATPQILAIAEDNPVQNLGEQLNKAIEASQARAAADQAARAPQVARPAVGTFTSPFGPRWGSFHYGVDIANAPGTPILAVMDGTVVDSGPASGYGNWIRIKHDDGSLSLYGHMQSLDVQVGQRVTAGQKIAGMGSLGFSTGPHLHFEIHPDGTKPVDPAAWLAARGINL